MYRVSGKGFGKSEKALTEVTIYRKWMNVGPDVFSEKIEYQDFMCSFSYLKYWLNWKTNSYRDWWIVGLWGTRLGQNQGA